jgi:hypothetical protein
MPEYAIGEGGEGGGRGGEGEGKGRGRGEREWAGEGRGREGNRSCKKTNEFLLLRPRMTKTIDHSWVYAAMIYIHTFRAGSARAGNTAFLYGQRKNNKSLAHVYRNWLKKFAVSENIHLGVNVKETFYLNLRLKNIFNQTHQ